MTARAFVDTETDGLRPDRRPWEIAIIREDGDRVWSVTIQVSDVDLSDAELKGLQVGRFYERHAGYAGKPSHSKIRFLREANAAREVERLTRDAHLIGAVPSFDAECLAAMLRRHKLVPAWHYHLIDIEAMAAGWLLRASRGIYDQSEGEEGEVERAVRMREAAIPPWKSDDLSRACGVEPPGDQDRHTAMGDALWVQRWYHRIVEADA